MSNGIAAISARSSRLSTRVGKIAEIKNELAMLKRVRRKEKKFTLLQKIDRKILGTYPYEGLSNKRAKELETEMKRILNKLKKGKRITFKEKQGWF